MKKNMLWSRLRLAPKTLGATASKLAMFSKTAVNRGYLEKSDEMGNLFKL